MKATSARTIGAAQIPDASRALARAFYDDPVVKYVWPHDGKRLERSERSFASQMRALWDRRQVHADDTMSCVAVWARPDEWEIPLVAVGRVLLTALRTRIPMRSLLAYLQTDRLHPQEPHWYLEFLGTVPERQGRGLGADVLRPVLEQADAEGIAVWTWSSNKRNLAFYHRHGFNVLDELPFAKNGPSIYPIRREPRG